ncbi:MAG: methyl-accepting chemotaxis protein, partial [Spirochaetaceae bacterium]|nr:methyl-accepting chemotaxis protein [Spirochaetaceae bacterium]
MKLRSKLTSVISTLMTVIITGITVLSLLQARSLQSESAQEIMKNLTGLHAYDISAYYQRVQDQAETMATLMGGYENLNPAQRRSSYQDFLHQMLEANKELLAVYTVWKPGTIDKLDRENLGVPGAAPDGRFAPMYIRESGNIELSFFKDYEKVLENLSSHNVVEEPEQRIINGKTAYSVGFRSPVILKRTGEIVGIVGVALDLNSSQELVAGIKPYGVGNAALYSNGGHVIAHQAQERIGTLFSSGDSGATLGETGIAVIQRSLSDGSPAAFTT